jgi:glycosyltransferase involved in cell wall biosynthesis
MKVAFEMISAGSGFAPAAGGMTTYYEGLARTLPNAPGVDEVVALMPPWTDHAHIGLSDARFRVERCRRLPRSRAGRVAYEHLALPAAVRRTSSDVLLCSHNVKPLTWRGPSVVVLQSLQYFMLSDPIGAARRAYLRLTVPRSLRSAERVIAVSEAARVDAINLFDVDPSRIVAVHHGPSPWAIKEAKAFERNGAPPRPIDSRRPYVLSVSSLYGFKNHRRLIEAFGEAVKDSGIEHDLVIAGGEADVTVAELSDLAAPHGVGDRVIVTGPFPQEGLPALYANADAIAYVSLYETFGHPILEAFAFGKPLLASNLGGGAEVAGDGALTVDPYDTGAIAAGLTSLLTDEATRTHLPEAGRRRLAEFTWERCAAETADARREAAEFSGR